VLRNVVGTSLGAVLAQPQGGEFSIGDLGIIALAVTKANRDGSYTVTGTQLSGLVTTGEDDMTLAENYPIVYLTDTSGHVHYARSFNFSSMIPSKKGEIQTAQFTLPRELPFGSYNLYVSSVGVSSKIPYALTLVPHGPPPRRAGRRFGSD
jgi:hypothetical protein